jgi:hypothetical protein
MRDNDTMFYLLYADIIGTSEDQMILQVLADAAVPNVHPMLGYVMFFGGLLAVAGVIKWITGGMQKS